MNKTDDTPGKLLADYRMWGLIAIASFIMFVLLFIIFTFVRSAGFVMLSMVFLSGLLWIGTTSISRHSLILLKRHILKEVSVLEFLSTQLVVFLFPFTYIKVKKEVDLYRKKISKGND